MHFNQTHRYDNIGKYPQDLINDKNYLTVDTLRVDGHLRLRFSKRVRKIISIQTGDELAVFQNINDNSITVNLQREGQVVDVWTLRRGIQNRSS
jgi:hypothetical protein